MTLTARKPSLQMISGDHIPSRLGKPLERPYLVSRLFQARALGDPLRFAMTSPPSSCQRTLAVDLLGTHKKGR